MKSTLAYIYGRTNPLYRRIIVNNFFNSPRNFMPFRRITILDACRRGKLSVTALMNAARTNQTEYTNVWDTTRLILQ